MKTGLFVENSEDTSVLKEVEKVFPTAIKKMPSLISSLPGYEEMIEGLEKDKERKHEEAMKLYERAGELGNKAGFMNMGNCYMFGKGVKQDKRKGIEMWKKCGKIEESEVRWMRKLSNDRFVCGEKMDLRSLFKSGLRKMNDLMKMVVNLWNKIGDSEACGIGEGLKINSTLTRLDLDRGVIFMYYVLIEMNED